MIRKASFLLAGVIAFLGFQGVAHAQVHFSAMLTPAQENPPTSSRGSGTGSFLLTGNATDGYTLSFDATATGLTGPITNAHFHNQVAGMNGGVVRGFSATERQGTNVTGYWTSTDSQPLTPTLAAALFNGEIYINFHTGMFPGGEIRGQLYPTLGFIARFTGSQENPPVMSPATGVATLRLQGNGTGGVELYYDFTVDGLSGPATNSHFHNNVPGMNGPVVRNVAFGGAGFTTSGVWKSTDMPQALTPALLKALINGQLYLNVHTAMHGGGEIRGQVLLK